MLTFIYTKRYSVLELSRLPFSSRQVPSSHFSHQTKLPMRPTIVNPSPPHSPAVNIAGSRQGSGRSANRPPSPNRRRCSTRSTADLSSWISPCPRMNGTAIDIRQRKRIPSGNSGVVTGKLPIPPCLQTNSPTVIHFHSDLHV